MANEATIRSSLQINANNLQYGNRKTTFKADVERRKGPTPGAITVDVLGTDVDLSELTTPGLCQLENQDSENYVTYGIYSSDTDTFNPLGELLPGEVFVLRLSRHISTQYDGGVGTGTVDAFNSLRFVANTAPVVVFIGAFDK